MPAVRDGLARRVVVRAAAGAVSRGRLPVAPPAGRVRAADRLRRRLSAVDRRGGVRRARRTPEPPRAPRAGSWLYVGPLVLEALAVPVPAARTRPEASPHEPTGGLAAGTRCRAPRTPPPRPPQLRRLPRRELHHSNSRRPHQALRIPALHVLERVPRHHAPLPMGPGPTPYPLANARPKALSIARRQAVARLDTFIGPKS